MHGKPPAPPRLQRGGRFWSSVTIFSLLECRLNIDQSPAGSPAGLSFFGEGVLVETLHALRQAQGPQRLLHVPSVRSRHVCPFGYLYPDGGSIGILHPPVKTGGYARETPDGVRKWLQRRDSNSTSARGFLHTFLLFSLPSALADEPGVQDMNRALAQCMEFG